jgi:1,2-diacylglycerol 3-beta-glucosyltransferase
MGQWFLLLAQGYLAVLVGYLLLLTAAAWQAPRRTPQRSGKPVTRFLILVPAHNEERLLPSTLTSLNALDYPRSLYTVHVIADNCHDRTAAVAAAAGATVHQRQDLVRRGKGYALQWLLQRLWQSQEPHEAVVILDADSLVSPNFLHVMEARLTRGERVIQAYYAVRDPERSWSVSLRYAALAVLHYLRPSGRMALGGSAGLKGNGMVFAADVLKKHQWTNHLTEDIEFHMELLLNGERVMFAPDAIVWAEMPETLAEAQTQNARWERGRLEMARRYVPQLARQGWQAGRAGQRDKAFLLFDAALEHIIPPFSILTAVNASCLALSLVLPAGAKQPASRLKKSNIILGTALMAGQLCYTLAGLHLANAPKKVYQALIYAPALIVWKLWLYGRVLLGRDRQGWVRTKRNGETAVHETAAMPQSPQPDSQTEPIFKGEQPDELWGLEVRTRS